MPFATSRCSRIQLVFALALLLCLAPASTACTDSSDAPAAQSVSGHVEIAGYTPSGPLWLVLQALDGTPYATGTTRPDGSFEVEPNPTVDVPRVLLFAVDPANPGAQAAAMIELEAGAPSLTPAAAGDGAEATSFHVGQRSSAELMVMGASGPLDRPVRSMTAEERAIVERLLGKQGPISFAPPACSLEQPPLTEEDVVGLIRRRPLTIRSDIDAIVAGPGELLERMRAAQRYVSEKIQVSNWPLSASYWLSGAPIGLNITRRHIRMVTGLEFDGFGVDRMGQQTLELAADVAVSHGYGNCREMSLAGAYLATRFPEVQQVVIIGYEHGPLDLDHAVAIACTGDTSVYNLLDYGTHPDLSQRFRPQEARDAGCMLIDPYTNRVLPIGDVDVSDWSPNLLELIPIDASEQPSKPVAFTSVPCGSPASSPCLPFEIPVDAPPPDGDGAPIVYAGPATMSRTMTTRWGVGGSVQCDATGWWEATVRADGTLVLLGEVDNTPTATSEGQPECRDLSDRPEEIYEKGKVTGQTFSIEIHYESSLATMIGTLDDAHIAGSYEVSWTGTIAGYGEMNLTKTESLTINLPRQP